VRVTYFINISSVSTEFSYVEVPFKAPESKAPSKLSQFVENALISIACTLGGLLFGFLVKRVRDHHHAQADRRTHGIVASVRDRLKLAIAYGNLDGEAGRDLCSLLADISLAAFEAREPPARASEACVASLCDALASLAHPLDPGQAAVVTDRSVLARIWATTSVARWVHTHPCRPWVVAHVALAVSARIKATQPAVATASMDALAVKQAKALAEVMSQVKVGDGENPMLPHAPPPSNSDPAQGISTAPERATPAEHVHCVPEWNPGSRGRRQAGRGAAPAAASGGVSTEDDGFDGGDSTDVMLRAGMLNPVRQSLSAGR
jgi:hypothetical protein